MSYRLKIKINHTLMYLFLIICVFVVLYPLFIMVITSFKKNIEVMTKPFNLPAHWSLDGYSTVMENTQFMVYYKNSFFITLTSLLIIVIASTLASYPLARIRFKLNKILFLYFIFGVMLPIRLAVVDLFKILQTFGLYDNPWGLIFVYAAMGIPFSILIITGFLQDIPKEIEEAARMDGCSDFRVLSRIFVPIIRPAMATSVLYNFLPIWNDFYFPLVFLKSEKYKTVPLGTANFFGQYQTDWPTIFAALTLAVVPPLFVYLLMSKQFIKGLTAGAVKG